MCRLVEAEKQKQKHQHLPYSMEYQVLGNIYKSQCYIYIKGTSVFIRSYSYNKTHDQPNYSSLIIRINKTFSSEKIIHIMYNYET